MADSPLKPFDNILNFRDVATQINTTPTSTTSSNPHLKPHLFYRSARPDAASPADRTRLLSNLKIATILDLRTPTEHAEQAKTHRLISTSAPATVPSDPDHPLRIEGITYQDVNFNGSAYSKALIKQLSYAHVAKLAGLYALGYRKQAIAVLGTNVMAQRGLAGLAEDTLTHSTEEIKQAFEILCNPASYPLVVHCTQGKDRTGLTVLLVLRVLGVSVEAIEADYCRSEPELLPERPEKLEEIRSIGLPDAFADCPREWTGEVVRFLDERYGGAEEYLLGCGVEAAQLEALREILVAR